MSLRFARFLVAATLPFALAACGTRKAGIDITPAGTTASDEPLHIVANGLQPHSAVTIQVSSTDAAHVRWSGIVKRRANASGRVQVPMSVLENLQPASSSLASVYTWPTGAAARFFVRVSDTARVRAARAFFREGLERRVMERPLTLARQGIVGRYFAPSASSRHPALLLFGGSEGGLASYGLGLARQIASHGIGVLDVAYWNYPGLPHALDRIPLEYFARGLTWLRRRAGVDATRIDVEGISRGSEAALLLGAYYPKLVHGVVASVPSNVAYGCAGGCSGTAPAWTYHGRAIRAFSPIPVERIRGPIFAICGTRDMIWPSCPQAEAIIARRRAHDVRYSDTLIAARGAGHFVGATVPYQIAATDLNYTQRAQDEAGAEELWPKLITFLGGRR